MYVSHIAISWLWYTSSTSSRAIALTFGRIPIGKTMNIFIPPFVRYIVTPLFYKDDFGIKKPTKGYMQLKKEGNEKNDIQTV